MRAPGRLVIALAVAVVTAGGGGASAATPTSRDDAVARRIAAAMPSILRRYRTPGAAVGLVEHGRVTYAAGFGFADVESKTPATATTVFRAGSLSKTVAAWGVMRLASSGALDLDAPVHLRGWLDQTDHPTARQLLSHTAGTTVDGYNGVARGGTTSSIVDAVNGRAGDPPVRVAHAPGSGFRYSSGGYALLQLLVEQTTNEPFDRFMRDSVLQPLGMARSGFAEAPTADGYRVTGRRTGLPAFAEEAPESLSTTAEDFARFIAATVGDDETRRGRGVVPAAAVDAMISPAPGTAGADPLAAHSAYGLGYFVEPLSNGERVAWHPGVSPGFGAMFALSPSHRSGVVVLTNSDTGIHAAADVLHIWAEAALGGDFGFNQVTERLGVSIIAVSLAIAGALVLFAAAALVQVLRRRRRVEPRRLRRWEQALLVCAAGGAWWALTGTPLVPSLVWHELISPVALAPPLFKAATRAVPAATVVAAAAVALTRKPRAPRIRVAPLAAIMLAVGGWLVLWETDVVTRVAMATHNIVPGREVPTNASIAGVVVPVLAGLLWALARYRRAMRPEADG